jgi:hypothetical protein
MQMQARPGSAMERCDGCNRARVGRKGIRVLGLGAVCCLLLGAAPAAALDDRDFCVLAQQLAIAAEKDVGVWIDRVTRNAGMAVSCDRKTVEFTRFTYAPSSSMNDAWKQSKAADWSATHCSSRVWGEAIRGGWKVVLSQTSADGGQVTITAQCGSRNSSTRYPPLVSLARGEARLSLSVVI